MNEPNNSTGVIAGDSSHPSALMRQATDIAGICKEIVKKTARKIGDRKFVPVEGWQSIATTYGCILSARDVETVETGMRAIADVKRMSDGVILASAEGFVGKDELTWYGGTKTDDRGNIKVYPKRAEYAIRAMAQTRAMSRAARTAFAFVVVLMDSGLDTTPAEEMDDDSKPNEEKRVTGKTSNAENKSDQSSESDGGKLVEWRDTEIHFGEKFKGKKLGDLDEASLTGWITKWVPKPYPEGSKTMKGSDMFLRQQLDMAGAELQIQCPKWKP